MQWIIIHKLNAFQDFLGIRLNPDTIRRSISSKTYTWQITHFEIPIFPGISLLQWNATFSSMSKCNQTFWRNTVDTTVSNDAEESPTDITFYCFMLYFILEQTVTHSLKLFCSCFKSPLVLVTSSVIHVFYFLSLNLLSYLKNKQ